MADVLAARDLADLAITTLRNLERLKFRQIAQNIQNYVLMGKMLKDAKLVVPDGLGLEKQLMLVLDDVAEAIGLFQEDNVTFTDYMRNWRIDWRHYQSGWAFDIKEKLMNRGSSMIQDVFKPRRVNSLLSLAKKLENKGWSVPGGSDDKDMFGIPYWVVYNSSTGFNGGAPSGHTTVGNINPTNDANWKNYTAQYVNISEADLLRKMRTGHMKTDWQSPIDNTGFRATRRIIYCGESAKLDLDDLASQRNENIGFNLGREDQITTFMRHPIHWVPQIDESTFGGPTAAVYMLDLDNIHLFVLKGDVLRESNVKSGLSHDVVNNFVNLTCNMGCVNRRTQSVFSTD